MNRINQLFKQKKKNILSVFFTAGHPHSEDTDIIIKELQNNGIDMLEIGIPFSDPMADGVVIQESSSIALKNGMNLKKLFGQLQNIRESVHIPLIMMGYLNPVMQFGFEKFCRSCRETGIDGMIIPDLPFKDYIESYKAIADEYGLKIIMLITPETSEERIRLIDENTTGFIYMVSSASTTGAQKTFDADKQNYFRRIKSMNLKNPLMIGFGISNRETLQAAWNNASGAIIGSKFVKLLETEKDIPSAVTELKTCLNIT
ncbi:MAG: tryptophan synthase subunit alpha [Candidatus Azobacteroides sp.]|nr:tryptophan synthase subunit alpha [Candidatus Azobacteroides sp.]